MYRGHQFISSKLHLQLMSVLSISDMCLKTWLMHRCYHTLNTSIFLNNALTNVLIAISVICEFSHIPACSQLLVSSCFIKLVLISLLQVHYLLIYRLPICL